MKNASKLGIIVISMATALVLAVVFSASIKSVFFGDKQGEQEEGDVKAGGRLVEYNEYKAMAEKLSVEVDTEKAMAVTNFYGRLWGVEPDEFEAELKELIEQGAVGGQAVDQLKEFFYNTANQEIYGDGPGGMLEGYEGTFTEEDEKQFAGSNTSQGETSQGVGDELEQGAVTTENPAETGGGTEPAEGEPADGGGPVSNDSTTSNEEDTTSSDSENPDEDILEDWGEGVVEPAIGEDVGSPEEYEQPEKDGRYPVYGSNKKIVGYTDDFDKYADAYYEVFGVDPRWADYEDDVDGEGAPAVESSYVLYDSDFNVIGYTTDYEEYKKNRIENLGFSDEDFQGDEEDIADDGYSTEELEESEYFIPQLLSLVCYDNKVIVRYSVADGSLIWFEVIVDESGKVVRIEYAPY